MPTQLKTEVRQYGYTVTVGTTPTLIANPNPLRRTLTIINTHTKHGFFGFFGSTPAIGKLHGSFQLALTGTGTAPHGSTWRFNESDGIDRRAVYGISDTSAGDWIVIEGVAIGDGVPTQPGAEVSSSSSSQSSVSSSDSSSTDSSSTDSSSDSSVSNSSASSVSPSSISSSDSSSTDSSSTLSSSDSSVSQSSDSTDSTASTDSSSTLSSESSSTYEQQSSDSSSSSP